MDSIPIHPLMPDIFFCNCKGLLLFIYLRMKYRVKFLETEDVTQTQAEKLMMQIDKMRNNYYSYFTDRKWQHTKDRDIIVNSSLLGIKGTVGMLEYIVNASN